MTKPGLNIRHLAVVAAVLLLAACAGGEDFLEPAEPNGHHPFPERASTTGRNAHRVHGIDIAKYQGNIDWHRVKQSGIAFAFIKATEGTDVSDKKFAQNWAEAKAAGIPRGAYHFNYWCTSFKDQFEWFRRNVPRDKDALPPVLDLEWNTHSPTCPRKVSRARAKREIRTFVRLAEAWYGKRPILYADIRFYRDVLSDGSFSQYPLWLRATRRLPQDIYKGRKWVFWQYSDRSRVPGIRGRVDKNAFAGSQREWDALVAARFVAANVVTPAAQTDDKPADRKAAPPQAGAVAETKLQAGGKALAGGKPSQPDVSEADKKQTGDTAKPAVAVPGSRPPRSPAAPVANNTLAPPANQSNVTAGKTSKAGKPVNLKPLDLRSKKPAPAG